MLRTAFPAHHPMRATVSIVTYNQTRHAQKCIESVLRENPGIDIILTANGHPPAAKLFSDLSSRFSNITTVVNETNRGFGRPHNHALTLCKTEILVCLNDDCLVGPRWLETLLKPFSEFPNAALCCPDSGCSELLPNFHGTMGKREYCEGACLAISVNAAREIGLFDETLPGMAYGEDSDLSLRMRANGKTLHWVRCNVSHAVASTSRTVPEVKRWQEENHAVLRERWSHYLRVRTFDFPIVITRQAANGDVLLVTPIIRALANKFPLSPISVETACPAMLENHPLIEKVARVIPKRPNELRIQLDMAYELLKNIHIVDAYAQRANLGKIDRKTCFFPSDQDYEWADQILRDNNYVAVHRGPVTWRSKRWRDERWDEIEKFIRELGFQVMHVGSEAEIKTTTGQLGALITGCKAFVGLDSMPYHMAQAVGIPSVGLFGITDPAFISTSENSVNVCSSEPSFGLRHRQAGKTLVDDSGMAMDSITISQVTEAIKKILKC